MALRLLQVLLGKARVPGVRPSAVRRLRRHMQITVRRHGGNANCTRKEAQ